MILTAENRRNERKKTVPVPPCPLQILYRMALIQSQASVVRTKVKAEVRWKQEILKRKSQNLEKRRENCHPLFPKGCVTCLLFRRFLFGCRQSNESHWLEYNTELMLKQCLRCSGWVGRIYPCGSTFTAQHEVGTTTGQMGKGFRYSFSLHYVFRENSQYCAHFFDPESTLPLKNSLSLNPKQTKRSYSKTIADCFLMRHI